MAAFISGVVFAALFDDAHELVEFGEDAGELLSLLTFLVFGAVFVGPAADAISWQVAGYALLSLTAVRMVAIALSLVGMRLRRSTVGLLGWFGPRGPASVVFGLEVLELADEGSFAAGEELFGIAALVVVASVVLHGVTARPLAGSYAARLDTVPTAEDEMPELAEVVDVPMRRAGSRRGSA